MGLQGYPAPMPPSMQDISEEERLAMENQRLISELAAITIKLADQRASGEKDSVWTVEG